MSFRSWLRRKTCKHDWALVWKRDYERHVLGVRPSPFRILSGDRTVYVCQRCGSTKDGPFIRAEEIAWADHNMINHFEGDE